MVYLTMTPAIVRGLQQLQVSDQASQNNSVAAEPSLLNPTEGNPISHGQIIAISNALRRFNINQRSLDVGHTASHHLNNLLLGARVYVEPPKAKNEPVALSRLRVMKHTESLQTSEYKALMARLRREEEDRAYERMINPPIPAESFSQRFPKSSQAKLFPAPQADTGENDEVSYADINRQMTLIINILLSIVACSVAIWLVARQWSTPVRLGLSMGGSGMVGVAEVVVYAGYLRRIKEAREKGTKGIENRKIFKTWIIGGENGGASKDDLVTIKSELLPDRNARRRKARPK